MRRGESKGVDDTGRREIEMRLGGREKDERERGRGGRTGRKW